MYSLKIKFCYLLLQEKKDVMIFSCVFKDSMTRLLHTVKHKMFFHREGIHRTVLISDDVHDLPNFSHFKMFPFREKNPINVIDQYWLN